MQEAIVGCFSPFRREWVVRGRRFDDGQVEVTVDRFDRYIAAQELRARPRVKRGESENLDENLMDAAKRAKQQVRLRCKAIGADRMITLTYWSNMIDKARLKRDFDAFRRRMSRYRGFHYVAVAERQKRGAWHMHVAVRGRLVYQLVRSIWQRVIGESGRVHVSNPFRKKGVKHKLAAYLSKYITKDFAEHQLNEKRYWTSRGVVVPELEPLAQFLGDSPVEAIGYAFEAARLAGASLQGCQVYWNDGLGCLWLAALGDGHVRTVS